LKGNFGEKAWLPARETGAVDAQGWNGDLQPSPAPTLSPSLTDMLGIDLELAKRQTATGGDTCGYVSGSASE
jgi:hypothetical protein